MAKYPFTEIEQKWQAHWEKTGAFKTVEDPNFPKNQRMYVLDMFPYPSGSGLHVGHPEGYTATDIYSRYLRANGFNVLHPMGFDSFGLPAENYAIKTGTPPLVTSEKNIAVFRKQIKSLGLSYDWDREISTHQPSYYRWTQWIFLQAYKMGLAYESEAPINWCPSCKTGLANEEVKGDGTCERCGTPVKRKLLRQWMMKITAYAQRLLDDLEELDWPEAVKAMQRNWIGQSQGAQARFKVQNAADAFIDVYTTRPDTLYGVSYLALAPEHPLAEKLALPENLPAVRAYIEQSALKSDLERTGLAKEKSGVFTGAYAENPLSGQSVPIWIADYVLASYGFGAVMAVPAHDARDWEFAGRFRLPIKTVVKAPAEAEGCYEGEGIAVNSGPLDGLPSKDAKAKAIALLEERRLGKAQTNYKLRDWLFSRQRYWGEPIPLVHCPICGIVPLPEDQLPLLLPETQNYQPTGTGESPLAAISDWVNTTCPQCGRPAKRETNTMPQWAGSCWYYLRFMDPHNDTAPFGKEKEAYWAPVGLYVGGTEHAVLHLLYARFWHKILYDIGLVHTKEPFWRLVNQGMILGENHEKMSKSRGNVINPDDMIAEYGADTLRLYEMFMGPLQAVKPWNTAGMSGVFRFLNRVYDIIFEKPLDEGEPPMALRKLLHKTIKKVTHDTQALEFNTAIAQMMIFSNEAAKQPACSMQLMRPFLQLLAPYAPHLAAELWQKLGLASDIAKEPWPSYSEELAAESEITLGVQINGKARAEITVPADAQAAVLEEAALAHPRIRQELAAGKSVKKIIAIPGKIVNVVLV